MADVMDSDTSISFKRKIIEFQEILSQSSASPSLFPITAKDKQSSKIVSTPKQDQEDSLSFISKSSPNFINTEKAQCSSLGKSTGTNIEENQESNDFVNGNYPSCGSVSLSFGSEGIEGVTVANGEESFVKDVKGNVLNDEKESLFYGSVDKDVKDNGRYEYLRGKIFAFVALILSPVFASDSDHKYQTEDPVTLWVNKAGPYNNPQETYNYYSFPFCHPSGNPVHKWGGLGEVLGGNELIDSQIDIKFQRNVDKSVICQLELDERKFKHFKDAIENSYWFSIFNSFMMVIFLTGLVSMILCQLLMLVRKMAQGASGMLRSNGYSLEAAFLDYQLIGYNKDSTLLTAFALLDIAMINTDLNQGLYNGYAGGIWSLGVFILELCLRRFPFFWVDKAIGLT